MTFPKKTKDTIIAPIPGYLIKERSGGKNSTLSYLSGSTVIDLLNSAFDYMWDWVAIEQWVQESQPKFNPKYDKEPVPQAPVAHVKGVLTVQFPLEDGTIREIKKTGYGSKAIIGGQSEQESIFKAAGTDALKKAASLLGIGLSLYRDEEEQYHFDSLNYENPWTDEMLEKFKEERGYIASFMETNELSDSDMSYYFDEFSSGEFDSADGLTPDNIKGFVAHLEAAIEAAE